MSTSQSFMIVLGWKNISKNTINSWVLRTYKIHPSQKTQLDFSNIFEETKNIFFYKYSKDFTDYKCVYMFTAY